LVSKLTGMRPPVPKEVFFFAGVACGMMAYGVRWRQQHVQPITDGDNCYFDSDPTKVPQNSLTLHHTNLLTKHAVD